MSGASVITLALLLVANMSGAQTLDNFELVFDSDSALGDITAPWPATDSLLLPLCPPNQPRDYAIVVHLYLLIGEDGTIRRWEVNVQPPNTGIAQELERVLPQWRFVPARAQGTAIPVWMPLTFHFFDLDSHRVPCRRYIQVEKQPNPFALYTGYSRRPPITRITLCRD